MKVIAIDDEPLALESMVRLLKRLGAEVVAAYHNPLEALSVSAWEGVDAAFVDIDMPGMNGLELASRLQTDEPALEIVFVTAHDQYAIRAFELAAVDYLLKPVQIGRLEATLGRLRHNRRQPPPDPAEPPAMLTCMYDLGIADAHGRITELPWRTSKAKELFAYLLHAGARAVVKDQLLELLWSELDVEKANANLHTTVYQVRQTLKSAGLPIRIQYGGGRYRLELAGVELDKDRWESAMDQALIGMDEGQLYRLLLDGYRGDYLQAEGYLWAENERERLRIKWLQQASEQALRLERSGLFADAVRLYKEVQDKFPIWEACYLGLMRIYDRTGNAAEVKNQYDKLRRTLEEELGMQPGREIAEWHERWCASRSSV